jgi:hypothetical protein
MFHQFAVQWKDKETRFEILSFSLGKSSNRHENNVM